MPAKRKQWKKALENELDYVTEQIDVYEKYINQMREANMYEPYIERQEDILTMWQNEQSRLLFWLGEE